MEKNVTQHEAFGPGLKAYHAYVYETSPSDFSGKKLREIIDSFGEIITTHLSEEIDTLLSLDKYGGKEILKLYQDFERKIQAAVLDKVCENDHRGEVEKRTRGEADTKQYRQYPMGLGAIDKTFGGGKYAHWPPAPWFVPYLTKWIFCGKYKGSWRFSPCTLWGVPRALEFAEVKE